ncbi:tetratricopeptide repeat protein [Nonlabens ponticola]|uniref:Tetratricopeptide repeat protein n=1 Tax=Nonlabens ponticola TaxID=2496866 RepID=A0A3S9MVS0_9FLAO|nr:tetratricopeptide repeat protein [Nonlabens ponticola]AZQ43229.1 tetratricopeptide repeat protein [Nonlabens ponticola]
MKTNFLTIFTIVCAILVAEAQESSIKSQAEEACECIKLIDRNEEKLEQNKQVEACINDAIMADQLLSKLGSALEKANDSTNTDKEINITINSDEGYEKIERKLIDNCVALNILLNDAKPTSQNSFSENKKAIEFYRQGYEAYNSGDLEKAVELYGKAVETDKKFAFAWDMLGIAHRRLDNYDDAIAAYKKSLKIDPKGKMPLQNLPIAYRLNDDVKNAIKTYEKLIKHYPEDPEGYFGLAQCGLMTKNYELAADNIFPAYKMYAEVNSPYKQDAEIVLSEVYQGMKANDNLDKFRKIAKKHDITLEE